MKLIRILGTLAMTVAMTMGVLGQSTQCKPGESAQTCFHWVARGTRLDDTARSAGAAPRVVTMSGIMAEAVTNAAQTTLRVAPETAARRLALRNTGAPATAQGTTGSTSDFASQFLAYLESSGIGTRDGDTLKLAYNVPLGEQAAVPEDQKPNNTLRFSADIKNPVFAKEVDQHFTASPTETKPTLGSFDDVKVSAAFEMLKRRRPENAAALAMVFMRATLLAVNEMAGETDVTNFRGVAPQATDAQLATIRLALTDDLRTRIGVLAEASDREAAATDPANQEVVNVAAAMTEMILVDPQVQRDVLRLMTAPLPSANLRRLSSPAESAPFRAMNDPLVAQVMDNMSGFGAARTDRERQFYFEASYHALNDLIGPDQVGATLTYEVPIMQRTASATRADARTGNMPAIKADAAAALTGADAGQSMAPRLTFQAGYHQDRNWDPRLDGGVGILAKPTPSSHVVSASLVGGWNLPSIDKDRTAKIDLNGTYENDSRDEAKHDRLIFRLTFTQKLTDTLSVPISIVYANHEKNLPPDVNRFAAHFGISYKLPM